MTLMRFMRTHAHATSYLLVVLGFLFVPTVASASASFANQGSALYVSSIALFSTTDILPSLSTKTRDNVRVVLTVTGDPAPSSIFYDAPFQSDSYTFLNNGSYDFVYHDENGAYGTTTVTIDNIDRIAPVITFDPYTTTSTNGDIEVRANTNEGTLNYASHTFTDNGTFDFVATDEAGNVATSTVTISNIDRVAPIVTLTGSQSVQVRQGSAFSDPGANATDAVDGSVSVSVSGSVDTDTVGTYTLNYDATDAAGNSAASVTRTVEVTRKSGGGGGGGGSRTQTAETTTPSSGRVLGAATYNFSIDLALKDTGADVMALQEALKTEGYFTEVPTGYFGPKTKLALQAYQKAHGIPQTGVAGPRTRAELSVGSVAPTQKMSVEAEIQQLLSLLAVLKAKLALLTT